MTTLYHSLDRRQHLSQPQMGRARHRWRGWRESGKVNLEIQQFYFDILKVDSVISVQEETFESNVTVLLDGGTVVSEDVEGLESLMTRVSALVNRVRMLEIGG